MIFIHEVIYLSCLPQNMMQLVPQLALAKAMDYDHAGLPVGNSQIQITLKLIKLYSQDGNIA